MPYATPGFINALFVDEVFKWTSSKVMKIRVVNKNPQMIALNSLMGIG